MYITKGKTIFGHKHVASDVLIAMFVDYKNLEIYFVQFDETISESSV